MARHRANELTWTEFASRVGNDVVILPVGAFEQHGSHLPLGTDALQVAAVADAVAEQYGCLALPVVSYGYKSRERSGGGETFPGTTSLDAGTLIAVVQDILRQVLDDGATKILVLDGHYENAMFLHEAIDLSLREHPESGAKILKVLWAEFLSEATLEEVYAGVNPGLDLEHAGLLETSIMRYLHPDLVRVEQLSAQAAAQFPPYDVYPETAAHVPATGALSDGSRGTAAIGERVFVECVQGLIAMLDQEFGPSQAADMRTSAR